MEGRSAEDAGGGVKEKPVHSAIRRAARWLVHRSGVFEPMVLIAIAANSVLLALSSNAPGFEQSTRGKALALAELVFVCFFAAEVLVTMLSDGPLQYFTNGWKCFDFTVVLVSSLSLLPGVANISSLRVARVLRPLRSVSRFPRMRQLVNTLVAAGPQLANVAALAMLLLIAYTVVSLNLFGDKLTNRCARLMPPLNDTNLLEEHGLPPAMPPPSNSENTSTPSLQELLSSGAYWKVPDKLLGFRSAPYCSGPSLDTYPYHPPVGSGVECAEGLWCVSTPQTDTQVSAYENFGWALVSNVLAMSTEGWYSITYASMSATRSAAWIFYVSLVIIMVDFLSPLIIAILLSQFGAQEKVWCGSEPGLKSNSKHAVESQESANKHVVQQMPQKDERPLDSASSLSNPPHTLVLPARESSHVLHQTSESSEGRTHDGAEETCETYSANLDDTQSPAMEHKIGQRTILRSTTTTAAFDENYSSLHTETSLSRFGAPRARNWPRRHSDPPAPESSASGRGSSSCSSNASLLDHENHLGLGERRRESILEQNQSLAKTVKEDSTLAYEYERDAAYREGREPRTGRIRFVRVLENISLFLILANTAMLASMSRSLSDRALRRLALANSVLTIWFACERIIILSLVGPRKYVSEMLNIFDTAIIFASVIEIIVAYLTQRPSVNFFSALRALRLVLRIKRIGRTWTELHRLVNTFFSSTSTILSLTTLLLLFVYCCALLAMELFGYQMHTCNAYMNAARQKCPVDAQSCPAHYDCYVQCFEGQEDSFVSFSDPGGNASGLCSSSFGSVKARVGPSEPLSRQFDEFWLAFLHIFSALLLEETDILMYDAARSTSPWSVLFFIFIVIIGSFLLVNLFVAVVLHSYGKTRSKLYDDRQGTSRLFQNVQVTSKYKEGWKNSSRSCEKHTRSTPGFLRSLTLTVESYRTRVDMVVRSLLFDALMAVNVLLSGLLLAFEVSAQLSVRGQTIVQRTLIVTSCLFVVEIALRTFARGFRFVSAMYNQIDIAIVCITALSAFLPGSPLQRAAQALSSFRALRLFRILRRCPGLKTVCEVLSLSLPSISNFILVVGFIYLIFGIIGMSLFKGTFASCYEIVHESDFEAKEPLDPAKLNVQGMDKTWCELGAHTVLFPNITEAEAKGFAFRKSNVQRWNNGEQVALQGNWTCERVVSQQDKKMNYSHKHRLLATWYDRMPVQCNASDQTAMLHNVSTLWSFEEPRHLQHEWRYQHYPIVHHYDHIGQSLLNLFELGTLELFPFYLHGGMSTVGEQKQRVQYASPESGLFYLAFAIFGGLFVTNLFVGVLMDKFKRLREGNNAFVATSIQAQIEALERLLQASAAPARSGTLKRKLYQFVHHPWFDTFVAFLIIIHVGLMCTRQASSDEWWSFFLFVQNVVFTAFFCIEIALRILVSGGIKSLLASNWFLFDFVVVTLSLIGIIVTLATALNADFIGVFRVLRMLRVFRVVPRMSSLRKVCNTMLYAVPVILCIGAIMLLCLTVYAIMGVILFADVRKISFLREVYWNFDNIPNAMLMLYRMSIGSDWNGVFWEASIRRECVYIPPDARDSFDDEVCKHNERKPFSIMHRHKLNGGVISPGLQMWLDYNDERLSSYDEGVHYFNHCGPPFPASILYFVTLYAPNVFLICRCIFLKGLREFFEVFFWSAAF